jgi:RNA-directed DNA polymerase
VRRVDIPQGEGRTRLLGIPTVADRIAQTVVKRYLEPEVEKVFHPDSSGYRPGKLALEAVGQARERCWRDDWGLDLDIQGFFDNIDHELLMRAVKKHTDSPWVLLYIERWLKAPVQMSDGTLVVWEKKTPQGRVASPLLANLFLH